MADSRKDGVMGLSKDLALSLYRTMVELREFELKAYEIFRSGQDAGFHPPLCRRGSRCHRSDGAFEEGRLCDKHPPGSRPRPRQRDIRAGSYGRTAWVRRTAAVADAVEACISTSPQWDSWARTES